jgi:FkbM family methyltransferase
MLSAISVAIARNMPTRLKHAVHGNRLIENAALQLYGTLLGDRIVTIRSGPMRGLKLATSQNVSHAHISGEYEREIQDVIHRHVQAGYVCYDLGASIGYLTLLMAVKARQVFAFEPSPAAAAEIRRQVDVNEFGNVTLVATPVTDSVREVRFCITDRAYGSGISDTETRWPVLRLESTTLDLFGDSHDPPDFVKIDVEGEETRVLRGAQRLLSEQRPTICCEVHSMETAREVADILMHHGYRLATPSGSSFRVPDQVTPGEMHVIGVHPARLS